MGTNHQKNNLVKCCDCHPGVAVLAHVGNLWKLLFSQYRPFSGFARRLSHKGVLGNAYAYDREAILLRKIYPSQALKQATSKVAWRNFPVKTRNTSVNDLKQSIKKVQQVKLLHLSKVDETGRKNESRGGKKVTGGSKVYDEIMLIQDLPFIKGQTFGRYNRMKMNLQSLVESKQLEANGYLKQIKQFLIKDSEGNRPSSQINYYQLVQLRDAIQTIKELQWTIQDGGEIFYYELQDSLKNEFSNLISVIHQNLDQIRKENSDMNYIKEIDQAFHQIIEIKNIAGILSIPLENFKIDDYMPDIETNLKATEKFLIKKQIIIQEEQSKVQFHQIEIEIFTQDHILKRSECERLDKFFTFLSQIKSKDIMLKRFDDISLNDNEKSLKKTLIQRVKQLSQYMDEFINNQMEYVKKDFECNFQKVKEYSEKDNQHNSNQIGEVDEQKHEAAMKLINDLLVRPIENLTDRFKMIKELKTRFPYLWQKLSRNEDNDDEFKTIISNFFLDLEQKIAISQGNAVSFFKNLRILKHLIPLDGYVHDDGQRIFQTKYDFYFKRRCEFSGQVILDSEKCMMGKNYEEIKRILETLTKLGDSEYLANIQRIQQKLQIACKTLTNSLQKQSNQLIGNQKVDPQKAENLNETIQQLQDLLFNFDNKILDKYFDEAKSQLIIFNEKMRKDFIVISKQIENSIQQNKFTEAQNKIDNYFKILNALNYSSINSEQEQEYTIAKQQSIQLQSLQDEFNQALDKLEKEFDYKTEMWDGLQNVDLSVLMDKKPRDILENLQKGIDQYQYPFYNQFNHIENKLDEAFSAKKQFILDSLYKGKSGKECLQLINEVTRTVNMLPENLKERFKIEFEELKTTYQELQQQDSKQIQYVLDKPNDDINAIKREVLNSKFSLDEECKMKLNKYYETLTYQIFNLIKQSDLQEVLEVKLPELWNFKNPDLNKYIKNLGQKDQDKIIDLLKQIFEEIIQKITSSFKERKEGQYFPSKTKAVSQYSKDDQFGKVIMQFFKLNKSHAHILKEIIPDMMSQFNSVINEAKEELIETDSKFQEAIHSKEQGKIKEAFDIIIHSRKADIATDFLQSKEFNQEFQPMAQKENYEEFLKIAEVTKKEKFCEQVIPVLKKTCEEIKNVEIINPQTRNNKKERQIVYNQLKNYHQILKDSKVLVMDLKEMNFDPIQVSEECIDNSQQKINKVIKDAQINAENIGDGSIDILNLGIQLANLN